MRRHASVGGRLADELDGRADSAAAVPFLVLDLGGGCDPHQARCRRCRWRGGWWMNAAQARIEHARHQATTHGRRSRRDRRSLVAWGAATVRPGPSGWGYPPRPRLYPGWRRPELGGVAVLVVITLLAALAAPHARTLRELVAGNEATLSRESGHRRATRHEDAMPPAGVAGEVATRSASRSG